MNNDDAPFINCGCLGMVLLINILLGGWSVNVILLQFFEKVLPFWAAALIGLWVGEFSIPVAVIIAILKFFHIL